MISTILSNSKKNFVVHPVIKHILARKNKRVPIKDKRKIVLVLFGGAMAGIRGAGAMIALQELGLSNAFNKIYSSSAGFCNASYLLSGNCPEGTSIYYNNLSGQQFINFFRPWRVVNIDHMIDSVKYTQPVNVERIMKSKTKLFVRVQNVSKRRESFLEVHKFPGLKYYQLMRAATVIPYLSPGTIKLGHYKYKDIITDDSWFNLLKDVLNSSATDILVIYNTTDQYKHIHKKLAETFQMGRIFEIAPKTNWTLTKLETDKQKLKRAARQMGSLTKKIFGSSKPIGLLIEKI